MQCIHRIGVYTVQKEIKENPHALLTNTKGGFFIGRKTAHRAIMGFFVRENGVILKTIAGLRLGVRLPAKRVTNRFSSFEIERQGGVREVFFSILTAIRLCGRQTKQSRFLCSWTERDI